MPEPHQFMFSFQEVAKALAQSANVKEGNWGLVARFGIGAANVNVAPKNVLHPAALVPILELGIQKFDEPNDLTIDASQLGDGSISQ